VECRRCGIVRQVEVPFADRRRSYTRSFERYVLELCGLTTIQDVAKHLGVSWGLVKGIHMRYLRRRFSKPRLKDLKHIAIDEISIQKGHQYLTVVLDLGTGAVVFVGQGRGADSLEEFWPRLRRSGARLEAVATDMLPAYISAVLEQVPEAALVFDRFHVVRLYNDKLALLRRKLQREADEMEKEVLKGTRWLLLKREEKLDEEKDERRRLEAALELNEPLATAYYMKDDLWQFWEQPDKESARMHLEDWIERARASGIGILKKFAATLESHAYGLLSWYDHPISTGPLEGTNNKIKTLQRQAYGYRDQQYFRLRIYGMHEQKYALIG
jgi:transposase